MIDKDHDEIDWWKAFIYVLIFGGCLLAWWLIIASIIKLIH